MHPSRVQILVATVRYVAPLFLCRPFRKAKHKFLNEESNIPGMLTILKIEKYIMWYRPQHKDFGEWANVNLFLNEQTIRHSVIAYKGSHTWSCSDLEGNHLSLCTDTCFVSLLQLLTGTEHPLQHLIIAYMKVKPEIITDQDLHYKCTIYTCSIADSIETQ